MLIEDVKQQHNNNNTQSAVAEKVYKPVAKYQDLSLIVSLNAYVTIIIDCLTDASGQSPS